MLAGDINDLFEGCVLEGEAHNQLHVFLGELLAHVNGLYSAQNDEERAEETEAIRELFAVYECFFK